VCAAHRYDTWWFAQYTIDVTAKGYKGISFTVKGVKVGAPQYFFIDPKDDSQAKFTEAQAKSARYENNGAEIF
jgi:hypothetical protein